MWRFSKINVAEGITELRIDGKPEYYEFRNRWTFTCWNLKTKKRDYFDIPNYCYKNSVSSQVYEIYTTSEEDLLSVAKNSIVKYAIQLDKNLAKLKRNIKYLEEIRHKIDILLLKT